MGICNCELRRSDRADRTEELFRSGYNCSQSVFATFAEELGLTVEEAAKIASPFGAGFGGLREVCGAVSGMALVIAYLRGYSDPKDVATKFEMYDLEKKMCVDFEAEQGSLICRELLGLKKGESLSEPAVRTEAYYKGRPCLAACRWATYVIEQYLFNKFRILVTYQFKTIEQRDAFYKEVCELQASDICMKQQGCIQYEYEVPADNAPELLLHEEWECRADQMLHMHTPIMEPLMNLKEKYEASTTLETLA